MAIAASRCSCRGFTFRNVLSTVGAMIFIYFIYIVSEPGEYSEWSRWTNCSATCGGGFIIRTRSCTNPAPGFIGLDCEGAKRESKICNEKPCPQIGGYSEWGKFGNCDKNCGGGKRVRKRMCDKPKPLNGGLNCDRLGPSEESQTCNTKPCPINGGYTDWGKHSECELAGGAVCGKGKKVRTRSCSKPVPQHGGKACEGPDKETANCEIPCPTTKKPPITKTVNGTLSPTTK